MKITITSNAEVKFKAELNERTGELFIDALVVSCSPFSDEVVEINPEIIGELEAEQKPKTRTEYKKVTSVFSLDRDKMTNGCYGELSDDIFYPLINEIEVVGALTSDKLLLKVEKEITWQDELIEFLNGAPCEGKSLCNELIIEMRDIDWECITDTDFIGMCHHVASLTDKPE